MLRTLSEKTNITTADLDMMSGYADYLNDTFNCNIKVNYDTGELTGFNPDDIKNQIVNKMNENRRSVAFDFITSEEFSGGYTDAAKKLIDAQKQYSIMRHEFDAVAAERKRLIQSGEGDNLEIAKRYDYLFQQLSQYKTEIENNEAVLSEMNSQLETNGKLAGLDAESIGVLQDAMMESARTGQDFISVKEETNAKLTEQQEKAMQVQQGIESAQGVITDYKDRILEIAKAYDESYTSAYNSFTGQYGPV